MVDVATQGKEALRLAKAEPPDAIVTDILMPECDGFELITTFRRDRPKLPILAVSGGRLFGAVDLLDVAARLGAHATLVKPFDIQALIDWIAKVVEHAPEGRRP